MTDNPFAIMLALLGDTRSTDHDRRVIDGDPESAEDRALSWSDPFGKEADREAARMAHREAS